MNLFTNIIFYYALPVLLIINNIYSFNLFPQTLSPFGDFMSGSVPYNSLTLSPEIDPYVNEQKTLGSMPPPFFNMEDSRSEAIKAYSCSLMPCYNNDNLVVCACNFRTGNVVTFKNKCDVMKHNCRFDTEFRIILNEICPWEYQSRRTNKEFKIDYSDPKYYN